ncbi:MAG: hypothetical protein WCP21_06825 [Armatimonadota bacterium]
MYRLLIVAMLLGATIAQAQSLADFWKPGQVREVLLGDLATTPEQLADWAANGVNCAAGVPPAKAHAAGMKTRTWFTMDYMDSRSSTMPDIEKRAARHENGTMCRPVDPLFPTVGQYGYTACVNNPSWQEFSTGVFRKAAQDDWDGVHVDFASHYEQCFCPFCVAAWETYEKNKGLSLKLAEAEHSGDFRTRAVLRELRMDSVMTFLGKCREAARAVKPGYSLDGTYHQDPGSVYQWQYGDHFDLMCIEGTTWGPFPPDGEQIVWLKTSRGVSRGRVPMSVTYHLLPDEKGEVHHGRMASDRLEVALAEILSQGAVSWLGLGGPKTGNLLQEHQPLVKSYYHFFADNEALVKNGQPRAQVALLFSPRSYLVQGMVHNTAYVIGEALMKAHVPFAVIGDRDLTAANLAAYQAVVALPMPVQSPQTAQALEQYAKAGGRLLVVGEQGKYDEQYRASTQPPAYLSGFTTQEQTEAPLGKGGVVRWAAELFTPQALGAAQYVEVNQQQPAPLAIEGFSKAEKVGGTRDGSYALYVDLTYQDGANLWGQVATFETGTHDWQPSRFIIKTDKPIKGANVHLLFRGHRGTAWFRDVKFGEWDEQAGALKQNLLGSKLNPAVDEVYDAAPGQNAAAGVWGPYAGGFKVEMIEGHPTVRISSNAGLMPGTFTKLDETMQTAVMGPIDKLLRGQRELLVTGSPGAANVYAEVCDLPGQTAVQLINYNASLHPELPELQQQKADVAVPVEKLQVAVRLPQGKQLAGAELRLPGQPAVKLQATVKQGLATVTLPQLRTYAMVVFSTR